MNRYFVFLNRDDEETYVGADPWPETETAEQAVQEVLQEMLDDGNFDKVESEGSMWVSKSPEEDLQEVKFKIDQSFNIQVF